MERSVFLLFFLLFANVVSCTERRPSFKDVGSTSIHIQKNHSLNHPKHGGDCFNRTLLEKMHFANESNRNNFAGESIIFILFSVVVVF